MDAFLGCNYRPDLPLRWRDLYEWQFQADRYGGNASMITGWDDGRLVGIHGHVMTPLFWGDIERPVPGAWLMRLYVEAEHRHGLGLLFLRRAQAMYPIVLAVAVSPDSQRIITRLGWKFSPRLPRYLAVLEGGRALKMANAGATAADIESLRPKGTPRQLASLRALSVESGGYRPEWSCYPAMRYGTIRSLAYLRWRYFDHPVLRYRCLVAGSAERPAVCVFRVEQAFGEQQALVGRVVEFFHPNDDEGRAQGTALMHAVLERLSAVGCVYADFVCSSRTYGETLLDAGWGVEPVDRQILPVRLSPIERILRHQNLEYGVTAGLATPTLEDMYVTNGDGDEDRPAVLSDGLSDAAEPRPQAPAAVGAGGY